MKKDVLTYNFEIAEPGLFKPKANFDKMVEVKQIKHDQYLSYVMFLGVGLPYAWGERLLWTKEQWNSYINNNDIFLYLGFAGSNLIGYFEMHKHSDAEMEIKYFGLLPNYIGQGLGGAFLSHAVNEAYKHGVRKISLHTCEFDSETAIKNYEARGFIKTKEHTLSEFVPSPEESIELIAQFYKHYLAANIT